jgi:hypothetical protein
MLNQTLSIRQVFQAMCSLARRHLEFHKFCQLNDGHSVHDRRRVTRYRERERPRFSVARKLPARAFLELPCGVSAVEEVAAAFVGIEALEQFADSQL